MENKGMDDFLNNMIGKNGITPPEFCVKALNEGFEGAVNIDWFEGNNHYEAIFYKDNIEYVAVYSKSGLLKEYKMFLPEGFLPENIKVYLETRGEVMNTLLINKGNSLIYEIIFRGATQDRHLLLLTELGKVIEERIL